MRKPTDTDSMELLLDTICNIFGGIILMAILVVLQTQVSVNKISAATENQTASIEYRRLIFDITELSKEIESLKHNNEKISTQIEAYSTPASKLMFTRQKDFVRAIKQAKLKLQKIKEDKRKLQKEISKIDLKLKYTASKLIKFKHQYKNLSEQITSRKKIPKRKIRLPHQTGGIRHSGKYFIIKDNKFYTLDNIYWSRTESYESGDCIVTPNLVIGIDVKPNPEKGLMATESNFRDVLSDTSPFSVSIVFYVYGNSESFATFQRFKNYILKKGYEYSVSAYSPSKGLTLVPGTPRAE